MLFAVLLLAQDHPEMTPAQVLEMHRARWAANPSCVRARDENEITVCARREADKYRVPLVEHGSSDNSDDQLDRFFASNDGHAPCGEGAFMVRCGSAGVSVRANAGGVHYVRRELAP
ncbi:hypothetical protein [Sphingomonas sp. KR3-1]|uniref:hypothetical protein n=1 Tax=Sphingomonas sp. KR3-1 TaxID=3156611 RepID=UPI0032B54AFC